MLGPQYHELRASLADGRQRHGPEHADHVVVVAGLVMGQNYRNYRS